MTSTSGAQTIALDLPSTEAVILANGWATPAHVERLRGLVSEGRQLIRALAEQNIITAEHAVIFDQLQQQQAGLPGFVLLKRLGAGGMGTVYLAIHRDTGEQVALSRRGRHLVEEHARAEVEMAGAEDAARREHLDVTAGEPHGDGPQRTRIGGLRREVVLLRLTREPIARTEVGWT